jgi:uncharacterized protein (TIGR03083 family)
MTESLMTDAEITEAIAAERSEFADLLSGLPARSWDSLTLCAGWRVRELVAHVTMPFRYSALRFAGELVRSGGKFDRMADRCARRDARGGADELLSALKDNVRNPWKPPGGGFEGALTHDVIHGLDFTVPLGIDRYVPEERLRIVLQGIAKPRAQKHFGVDLRGIELRADDIEWSFGSGTVVSGNAQDLALVVCGRKLPSGRLYGDAAGRFTAS